MNTWRPARAILTLGDSFYDSVQPARFPQHILRHRNQRWAEAVGLGDLDEAQWIGHFGRFQPLSESLDVPLALRYHGHQFRSYNPDIGDGRGFLFAQLYDQADRLLDLGTKGSGTTPYSRFGDGRLTLKGGVREVLATEMLEALGVNTSKSFSLIETGEALTRNDEPSPTRGAVLVRLSHSHIRYGSFQRLATLGDSSTMVRLVDYCTTHFLGARIDRALEDKVAALMAYAVTNAAAQAAAYMAAGFVHGVLNTDNINITGESFDYGPYRFAHSYDPGFTAAYFDHDGLYAFGRQAEALHWNVYQLARALLLLVPQQVLIPALERFPHSYEQALWTATCQRLGIEMLESDEANRARQAVIEHILQASQLPLHRFYHDFYGGPLRIHQLHADNPGEFAEIHQMLDVATPTALAVQVAATPYHQTTLPESLGIGEIEVIWAAIAERNDWSQFDAKIAAIHKMGTNLKARS